MTVPCTALVPQGWGGGGGDAVALLHLEPHVVGTAVHGTEQALISPHRSRAMALVSHVSEDHYLLPNYNLSFPHMYSCICFSLQNCHR